MNSLQFIVRKSRVEKSILSPIREIFLSSALAFSSAGCMPCYGNDSNCGEGEICVENVCVPQEGREGENHSRDESTGVFSQLEYADMQGEANIFSPQGDFSFAVEDAYTGERLAETELAFLQGEGFSLLTLGKPAYVKQLEIVLPETPLREAISRRTFALTPAPYQAVTIFDYYFSSHQEKVLALADFQGWAENTYVYRGCKTKEELQRDRNYTMALFSFVFGGYPYYKVVSTVYSGFLGAEELGILDTLPYEMYKVYDPLNFTAPPLLVGVPEEEVEEECLSE